MFRGMMGLEVLEALERECNGRKICDMFDHIIGVSTGAIIAALLGGRRLEVSRCREIYM
jgi:patatin-like phospholipase/acyl hydrolase